MNNNNPEAQGNPKRYQVEFAIKAALMEDALSGNLGPATTQFLKAISPVNKKVLCSLENLPQKPDLIRPAIQIVTTLTSAARASAIATALIANCYSQ